MVNATALMICHLSMWIWPCILFPSISSEILVKSAKLGVPVLVSRSAPTDLAVQHAGDLGVTIAGFVRNQRMNVYTLPERIIP